jgi:hypothetical protein
MGAHGDHGVLGEGSWVPKGPKRAQGQPLDPWVLHFCSKASGRGCSHSLGRWACWPSAKSCCCCVCCVCCLRGWRGWRWWRCYCIFGCGACRFVWLILFLSVWYRLLASAGDALPLFCTLGVSGGDALPLFCTFVASAGVALLTRTLPLAGSQAARLA